MPPWSQTLDPIGERQEDLRHCDPKTVEQDIGKRRGDDIDPALGPAARVQHTDPHQERLLEDQHEGGGHNVTRVAALRVEERHRADRDRADRQHRRAGIHAGGRQSFVLHFCAEAPCGVADSRHHRVVNQEITGITIGRDRRRVSVKQLALKIRRNNYYTCYLTREKQRLCFREVVERGDHLRAVRHVDAPGQFAAGRRSVLVDDHDGNVADNFGRIGLRIKHRIEDDGQDHGRAGRFVGKQPAQRRGHGAQQGDHAVISSAAEPRVRSRRDSSNSATPV